LVKCIIDWKTSANIYETHKLQQAAYANFFAGGEIEYISIVRLGSRSKSGFEFWFTNEYDKYYNLFSATQEIWKHENQDINPRFMECPESLSLLWGLKNA
jgi:hypothetical protein